MFTSFVPFHIDFDLLKLEFTTSAIKDDSIDQSLHYCDREVVEHWQGILNDSKYNVFDVCTQTLENLLARIDVGHFRNIINLGGGGAPQKDIVILDKFLKDFQGSDIRDLKYSMIDISNHMISLSYVEIMNHFTGRNRLGELDVLFNINNIVMDMFQLEKSREQIDYSLPCLFTLLGGTFGNLDEKAILNSINSVAKTDDILIVGIEVYDGTNGLARIKNGLVETYSSDSIKALFLPTIEKMYRFKDGIMPEPPVVMKNISAEIRMGHQYEEFSKCLTPHVFYRKSDEDRNIELLKSSRFDERQIVEFFALNGWRIQCDEGVSAEVRTESNNLNYKQFCFSRI